MSSDRQPSVCPLDCPSTCALDVERVDAHTVGRLYGAKEHSYTQGVICAKVSRYAERAHHPDRLTRPLRRIGKERGPAARFEPIRWDDALDLVAERFLRLRDGPGAEAIWPFHYAGTMGLLQRDGLDRLRHAFGTSRQHSTYCVALSDAGWYAGAGTKRGADTRLMHKSDLVIVWGGNPVSTQVNVMHHLAQARRERNALFVVVDPYRTKTAEKADLHLMLRPGTDGALACAVMHVLFTESLVDRDYIAKHTRDARRLEQHVASRTPAWAADITGLSVEDIVRFARLYGGSKQSFLRIGYGFTRSRNGAVNMHAVSCLPALSGAWQEPGGGALYGNSAIYDRLDTSLIKGSTIPCDTRVLDQSRIGQVLTGNSLDLGEGPPVQALFVQNTNPAVVAPETRVVLQGLAREDLFIAVHEQFLTETAQFADVIFPATTFLEHDDLYKASGHTHLQVARALVEAPGECRSNHELLCDLATRLGLEAPGFAMSAGEVIEATLAVSGLPAMDEIIETRGIDVALPFETANFNDGFGTPDGLFHFAPDWASVGANTRGMPELPDHWSVTDAPSTEYPLRLVTAPARQFLNTTFNQQPTSRRMERGEPTARVHPEDVLRYRLKDGEHAVLENALGEVILRVQAFTGLQVGTVVVESLWRNADFQGGLGINTLVSSEPGQPAGGAVYHDTAVRIRPAAG